MLENELFFIGIKTLAIIIEWSLFKIIIGEISSCSSKKSKLNILIIISIIINVFFMVKQISSELRIVNNIIISFLIYYLNYEVEKIKSFMLSIVYWSIVAFLDFVGYSFVIYLNTVIDMNKLLINNIIILELFILTKSILILIIPFIKGIKLKLDLKNKDFINLSIGVITNLIIIIVNFRILTQSMYSTNIEVEVYLITILMLLSNISLVSIVNRIIKYSNLKWKYKLIQEKMEVQYSYYLKQKETQLKVRNLYHDMKNHITCIQKIYEKRDMANKYIEGINNELNSFNSEFYTNNMILDIILSEKSVDCKRNDIEFLVDIDFSKCNFIKMEDVCSIFSNLIDNAIEACNKINNEKNHKKIKLKGTIVNDFFIIKCTNSKANKISCKNGKFLTDKKDIFYHGLGIGSIKYSLKKYSGNMEIDISNDMFIITMFIPLN